MKMKMKMIAILWSGLFLFPLFSTAQSDGSLDEERFETSVFSKVDAYIEREMERQRLPGLALGIVKGDRPLYLRDTVKPIHRVDL